MGMVVINSALVLQLSWIPVACFLEGANWVSGRMAVGVHHFALAYIVAIPLAYGARLWFNGGRSEVIVPWLLRCQLPLTFAAGLIYAVERIVPHVTLAVIAGMMIAGMLLVLYGVALRREGAISA